jgi:hypothetical protein
MIQEKVLMIEEFLRANCDFLTCEQLSEELDMPYDTVYGYLQRLGLKAITAAQQARNMIREYGSRKNVTQLARMIESNEYYVVRLCKELGVVPLEKASDSKKVTIRDRLGTVHDDVSIDDLPAMS